MSKIPNWSKQGEDSWTHDKFDLRAEITKEHTEGGNKDRDYYYLSRVIDLETREETLLYYNDHTNKQEAREKLVDFLKDKPYEESTHVMTDSKAVQMVARGIYTGYPWIEPDGRMPEEDGTGEFGAGETVQGTSETLGELDWQILNSISDKTVRSGYYANHRDVHQDHYVIVGEDEEQVKRMKKRMEALDERTLDEDQTVDHLDYEQLNEDAESQNVKILRSGRRRPATEHNVPGDNEIIEAEDKAYIAEEVSV